MPAAKTAMKTDRRERDENSKAFKKIRLPYTADCVDFGRMCRKSSVCGSVSACLLYTSDAADD